MTDTRKWVYRSQMPVRWGDMDAFGHVNNAVYLTYFEQARVDWWDSLDMNTHRSQSGLRYGPVVLTAQCYFKLPVFYPSRLMVDVYASPPGRSSFVLDYEIRLAEDPDTVYTEGSTKIVWVDYQATKAVRLPDAIRSTLPEQEAAR